MKIKTPARKPKTTEYEKLYEQAEKMPMGHAEQLKVLGEISGIEIARTEKPDSLTVFIELAGQRYPLFSVAYPAGEGNPSCGLTRHGIAHLLQMGKLKAATSIFDAVPLRKSQKEKMKAMLAPIMGGMFK